MSIIALRTFEAALAQGGGTLTGGPLSYADLALFLHLWELLEEDNWPEALTKLQLPQLDQFVKGLAARPKIAAYLANSRMPRNGPFDGTSYPFKPGRTALPDAGKKQEL
jgi:glutathione S-transferase